MTKILRRISNEEGMALVMAVGFLAVLTVVATTMLTYSSSNSRNANVHKSREITEQYAEAGLAHALAVLANAPNATAPTNLPGVTATFEHGSVYYSGILTTEIWNITSVSTVKNPAGGADLHKTLTAQVQIGIDPDGNNAWNYVYSDAPSTRPCMDVVNSVAIGSPLFVRGNLCLGNTSKVTSSLVKIGGTLQTTQSGSIGDSTTSPITYAGDTRVAGGCRNGTSGAFVTPCTTAHRVWTTTFGTDPGTLVKPAVDFQYWYDNARPGPVNTTCATGGSVPFTFDNDTALNRSNPAVDIMTATAYSCSIWSGAHLLGKLAWTPDDGDADSYGSLEVRGTVFFDGPLDMSSGTKAIYSGRGTLYASGKITFGTQRQVCGSLNCDLTTWDPEANLMTMVGGYCLDVITSCDEPDQLTDGFAIGQSGIFQGAVYVVSNFHSTSTGEMQGPIIAHQLIFEQQGVSAKWVPIEAMTMGTPGGGRKLNVLNVGGY